MQPFLIVAERVTKDELDDLFPDAVYTVTENAWVGCRSVDND